MMHKLGDMREHLGVDMVDMHKLGDMIEHLGVDMVEMMDNILNIVDRMMDDDMVDDRVIGWHGVCDVRALYGFIKDLELWSWKLI